MQNCKLHIFSGLTFWHVFGIPCGITIRTMKNIITLLFAFITLSAFADVRAIETIEVSTDQVGINFENNDKTLVLTFSDKIDQAMHCVIDIERINDLEYKTRVMRYFGGLLVNETHKFKNLVVVIDGERMEYNWSRDNVSIVVKKMCHQAEMMI